LVFLDAERLMSKAGTVENELIAVGSAVERAVGTELRQKQHEIDTDELPALA
jgi:hypothetical protein